MTKPTDKQIDAVRDREMIIAATIERCAKVAERIADEQLQPHTGDKIASAIRTLKDKP